MAYTDRFSGQGIQPARVPYRKVTLVSTDAVLYWPAFADADNSLADIMDVTTLSVNLNLILPDAREGGPGAVTLVKNVGSNAFNVCAASGTPVANILPGQVKYIYLTDNSTQDGVWAVTIFGIGTAALDVVSAAGAGLVAIAAQLALGKTVNLVAGSRAVAQADRATVLVWTGGSGTLSLPLTSGVKPFNFEVRNQGSGALTLAPAGGETIDSSASIVMGIGEATEVNAGDASWYTVGRGRPAQFNFTLLNKTVTGGSTTLSLTEAANTVQRYTGTLTSNQDIVLPAVVQVYYVTNSTTGAFNLRFKNPGNGATVSIPQGQSAVLFSDGTNVINQATTIAGLSSIIFAGGTAGSTPVGIGASNTGLYQSAANEVGVSANGNQVAAFDTSGLRVIGATPRVAVQAAAGAATLQLSRPAGQAGAAEFLTGTSLRWRAGVESTPESGSNVGSNFMVNRFSDAGALVDTPVAIDRATGYITVKGIRDLSRVGEIAMFIGDDSITHPFCILSMGQLVSRTTYADLWAYAQTTTPVSEAVWTGGQSGRFSVGDGSTTFRLPDLRAVHLRGLDLGRGIDVSRLWGAYQDASVPIHNHGVTDPTHSHTVSDPSHSHGVGDPGHNHGGSTDAQGYHDHHMFGAGGANGGTITSDLWCAAIISAAFGEKRTDGAGNHTHNIVTSVSGTGIFIGASATGITIQGRATGITVNNAGSADGHPVNQAYPLYLRY